jgi:NAD(P)-dependent dehydrogenase (short-subunit alcohol dehydrogenase family)
MPLDRPGAVRRIAPAVLRPVADDADFITGSTLSVNGG